MTAWKIGAAVSGPQGGRLNQPEEGGRANSQRKIGEEKHCKCQNGACPWFATRLKVKTASSAAHPHICRFGEERKTFQSEDSLSSLSVMFFVVSSREGLQRSDDGNPTSDLLTKSKAVAQTILSGKRILQKHSGLFLIYDTQHFPFLAYSSCTLSSEKPLIFVKDKVELLFCVLCVNQSDQAWKSQVKVRGDVGDNLNQIFSGDTSQPAPNPTMHQTDGQKREKTVLFSNFSHPTLFCELRKDLTWSDLENALVGIVPSHWRSRVFCYRALA